MVPKSFSRASLGCPVRLRNNTMPAALEEGGVLPWRELSMTWARLDAKITASNNDLRGGSRPALPPASSRTSISAGEGRCSKKTRGRNAARSEGVCPWRPLQRPKRNSAIWWGLHRCSLPGWQWGAAPLRFPTRTARHPPPDREIQNAVSKAVTYPGLAPVGTVIGISTHSKLSTLLA